MVGIITERIASERGYYPGPDIEEKREKPVRNRACNHTDMAVHTRSKNVHEVTAKDSGREDGI